MFMKKRVITQRRLKDCPSEYLKELVPKFSRGIHPVEMEGI